MTRAHIADPHLVRKIIEGREARDPSVRRRDVLPRPDLRGRRGAVHPQRATSREATMPHEIAPVGLGAAGRDRRRRAGRTRGGTGRRRARPRRDACSRRCRGPAARSTSPCATRAARDLLGHRRLARRRAATGSASRSATTPSPTAPTVRRARPRRGDRRHRRAQPQLPSSRSAATGSSTSWDVLGGDVDADRRRAVLRRQRHPLGAVGGRDDRPIGCEPGDRDPRADVRDRGRRHEPRAVRQGVQRERHPDHAPPAGARRSRRDGGRLCVEIGSDHTAAPRRPTSSTGSSSTTAPRPIADAVLRAETAVVEPRRRRLRRADRRPPADARAQPRRQRSSCSGSATPSAAATSTPRSTTRSASSRISDRGRRTSPATTDSASSPRSGRRRCST